MIDNNQNLGDAYEIYIVSLLKRNKIIPRSFIRGGSSSGTDCIFTYKNIKYNTEIKYNISKDYGAGSLVYDLNTRKWVISGRDETMQDILKGVKVEQFANQEWMASKQIPKKYTIDSKFFTPNDVEEDYLNFREKFKNVENGLIGRYYNSKNVYYIQIKNYGLYYLGKDIADLGVPIFNPPLRLRIRLKRKDSVKLSNYNFTTAIQLQSMPQKSSYNLEDLDFLNQLKISNEKK